MDILSFKPKNILSEEDVDLLAEYWCDADDTRDENLGQFIQRVAEIGMEVQNLKSLEPDLEAMGYCPTCGIRPCDCTNINGEEKAG